MNTDPGDGLLLRLAAGEPGAADAVIRAYGGLIWSLALRFCPTRDDAEDAVQEILIDIWKSAERYRATRASERVFVGTIARRRLIDRLRRERRRAEIEPVAAGPGSEQQTPGTAGERGWEAEHAARMLAELSADQRRVIELSVAGGLTQREIAAAIDMPLGTVKTHMRRGLIRLRELMLADDTQAGRESSS